MRRLTGLRMSRTADYVKAPDWVVQEFCENPKGS